MATLEHCECLNIAGQAGMYFAFWTSFVSNVRQEYAVDRCGFTYWPDEQSMVTLPISAAVNF